MNEAARAAKAGILMDTHAHLADPAFSLDLARVLSRARDAGVDRLLAVAEDETDAERNLRLASRYPMVLPAAGLHPAHADPMAAERVIRFIERERSRLWAIGEVGLDFWVAKDDGGRSVQKEVFEAFIKLSLALDLPLNVHSRSSGRHAIELLLKHGAQRVQLHAFDGKASAALAAVEAGYFFSIPPSIVRSRQKQKLLRHLPPTSLLLETDSPVLGPWQGERNEPANLMVALEAASAIKGMAPEELREEIVRNTERLYGVGGSHTHVPS